MYDPIMITSLQCNNYGYGPTMIVEQWQVPALCLRWRCVQRRRFFCSFIQISFTCTIEGAAIHIREDVTQPNCNILLKKNSYTVLWWRGHHHKFIIHADCRHVYLEIEMNGTATTISFCYVLPPAFIPAWTLNQKNYWALLWPSECWCCTVFRGVGQKCKKK